MFPATGEKVRIEYLDIDELEAKCWILEYCMLGYLNNSNMKLKLSDLNRKDKARVTYIDSETGRIELSHI